MITFILLAVGALIVVAAILVSYSANQRKRAGQSGQAAVNEQHNQDGNPTAGRPTGIN